MMYRIIINKKNIKIGTAQVQAYRLLAIWEEQNWLMTVTVAQTENDINVSGREDGHQNPDVTMTWRHF